MESPHCDVLKVITQSLIGSFQKPSDGDDACVILPKLLFVGETGFGERLGEPEK